MPGHAREIAYIDLCFSADKSVALAWAFAPTEAERNAVAQAHRDAVEAAMAYVSTEIGQARRGKAGKDGAEPGQVGWIAFDHYASRPTVEIARAGADGVPETELVTLKVAGDPNLHTHVAVPNVVLAKAGRAGSLDLQRLDGRIHEFGAYYQAHLAQNLRRLGVATRLDERTGAARLTAIPDEVRDAFSKRTRDAEGDARAYAQKIGRDWDTLSPDEKVDLLKGGAFASRKAKADDLSDFAAWTAQAKALGWKHGSAMRPKGAFPELGPEARGGSTRLGGVRSRGPRRHRRRYQAVSGAWRPPGRKHGWPALGQCRRARQGEPDHHAACRSGARAGMAGPGGCSRPHRRTLGASACSGGCTQRPGL
jgi:hypothetical protein